MKRIEGEDQADESSKKIYRQNVGGGTVPISSNLSMVHTAQMNPESWAIFGLISALVIPPVFYAVFYILAIALWYKILIWIGVIFIAFCLTRNYRVIKCLRFIGDKAYGKHKL